MISYVKGRVAQINTDSVILDIQNLGLEIFIPQRTLGDLPEIGEEVLLHTYFKVSEDAMTLYGFLSQRECGIFRGLLKVNGVGPRAGLSLLSTLDPGTLEQAILLQDAKAIAKAPGIGLKLAQRIILDLKDKDLWQPEAIPQESGRQEALEALEALGYKREEARQAVEGLDLPKEAKTEEILKQALRALAVSGRI